MARNNDLVVTAGLNIEASVAQIEKDLKQVNDRLSADHALKIIANIDLSKTTQRINSQLATISKNLKLDIPKVEIGTNISNTTNNIMSGIQKESEQVAKSIDNVSNSLRNLADTYTKTFTARTTNSYTDADKNISYLEKRLSPLGNVSIKGIYSDNAGADSETGSGKALEALIATIKNAQGELRTLRFELNETGNAFEYVSGTYNDSGVAKVQQDYARLEKELANFRASHKAIEDGLTEPLEKAQTALDNLKNHIGSVDAVEKAFDSLKTSAADIAANLKSTGSSFNIFDNAANKAKNFENVIKALSSDVEALSDEAAKTNLGSSLSAISKDLSELQTIESSSGRGQEWSKKYKEVSNAIQNVSNGLKAAQKEEKALDCELSKSNKINKLTADMKAYAAANERAVKSTKQMSDGMTFADKWSSLSQMAQNANLTDRELKKLVADMAVFKKEASAAGISGASAFDKFAKSFKLVSTYISANQIINMAISKIREAVEELKNVDNILTEISKTSERSAESLSKLGKGSFDVASKYGRTASDYLLGVQEMSRAGFGEVESENLAQLSLLAQSAGDMTAELANEYIIATNAAYGYQGSLEKLTKVLDSQNYVTNHYALNMSQLAEATKIAGSQAAQSGIGIDEMTAALATMISTTQQGGEIASRALRGKRAIRTLALYRCEPIIA